MTCAPGLAPAADHDQAQPCTMIISYRQHFASRGLLLRRPVLAAALGVLTSVSLEAYQAATGTRVGTFTDVVSNGLGAAVGASLAAVVLGVAWVVRGRAPWAAGRV